MTIPAKLSELLRWTLVGALVGLVILGGGGRVAMRVIARAQGAPGAWTFGGTLTVVALGGVSGAAGGALHVLARWAARGQETVRRLLYVIVMLLITWRGVSPASTLNVAVFFPVVIAFMVAMEAVWLKRRH